MPDPLPPSLSLSAAIERQVEDATHLLGQVEMCRTLLPNANLLIYSSLQREALARSTIEGTVASPDDLVLYQVSDISERAAVREVGNYREALEWGVEQLAARPIATVLILGLHERLLTGVRGASSAGRFKDRQNYIGSHPIDPIEQAVFVPPASEDVRELIAALERYTNAENREARVVQLRAHPLPVRDHPSFQRRQWSRRAVADYSSDDPSRSVERSADLSERVFRAHTNRVLPAVAGCARQWRLARMDRLLCARHRTAVRGDDRVYTHNPESSAALARGCWQCPTTRIASRCTGRILSGTGALHSAHQRTGEDGSQFGPGSAR